MTSRQPHATSRFVGAIGLLVALGTVLIGCSSSPSTAPSIAAASPLPTVAATSAATGAGPTPTPTPITGTGPCNPAALAAAIVSWDAGAGHRNATITLTNNGKSACTIRTLATPQLINGDGAILIDGQPPTSTSVLTLQYYDVVNTVVSDANYCGSTAPVGPVTVAFVFPGGEGRVVAAPAPGDGLAGVPPCNGAGSGGQIEMQPFTR